MVQVCEQAAGKFVGPSEIDHAAVDIAGMCAIWTDPAALHAWGPQVGGGQGYETAVCRSASICGTGGREIEQAHPGETAAPGRGSKHEVQKSERCAGCTVPAQLRLSSRYTDATLGKVLDSKPCHCQTGSARSRYSMHAARGEDLQDLALPCCP